MDLALLKLSRINNTASCTSVALVRWVILLTLVGPNCMKRCDHTGASTRFDRSVRDVLFCAMDVFSIDMLPIMADASVSVILTARMHKTLDNCTLK